MVIKDEYLFTVNSRNRAVKPQLRKLVHSKGLWHRTCQIWIINDRKEVLCQRRSLKKDMNPGKWENVFGGHMAPRQTYADCALGELREELALKVGKQELHVLFVNKCTEEREFQGICTIRWSGDLSSLKLEKDEVEEIKWISMERLLEIHVRKDKNWSRFGYEVRLLKQLIKK